jgi:hypothetical protein
MEETNTMTDLKCKQREHQRRQSLYRYGKPEVKQLAFFNWHLSEWIVKELMKVRQMRQPVYLAEVKGVE